MYRLLREPLLHFLVLAALLFVLYGWLQRGTLATPNEIVLSAAKLNSMQAQFAKVWQRPPTAQEMQGLIDNWVRDEVFYREGLALGLDRDDPIVRRRIGQKVAFLVEGGTPAPPTTEELQAWLEAHPDDYRIEPTYSLRQVYFDPARHDDRLKPDVDRALSALNQGKEVEGDSTLLPHSLDVASRSEIVRVFGTEFANALQTLPVGAWSGPVRSGFGVHLVDLSAREEGHMAKLDEVRPAVERDLQHARTEQANTAFYEKLRANYTVRIDSDAGTVAATGADASAAGPG